MDDANTFLANYFSFLGNMYWLCYLLVVVDIVIFVVNLILKANEDTKALRKILSIISTIITIVLVLLILYGFAGMICAQMGYALPGTNYLITK